jgi:hypothetical protein
MSDPDTYSYSDANDDTDGFTNTNCKAYSDT